MHLDDPSIVVVDTRFTVEIDDRGNFRSVPGRGGYEESHIEGAVFLDLLDLRDPDEPRHILDPSAFADVMSGAGIGSDHEVVVYDTEGGTWAARLWWALQYHGHEAVRILDGGFVNWQRLGLPTRSGNQERPPSRFIPDVQGDLRADMDDVLAAIDEPGVAVVDALPEPFYTGQVPLYPHLRAGHITSARNVSALENIDPSTWMLLPRDELAAMWELVIGDADRIITYCGGGVYAAFDLFVLHLLGHRGALYDGSWEEWGASEQTPVETGPDPTESEES